MKRFTSKNQRIGELGETIACKYLVSRNFKIMERNFTRKWGEIDIIAQKDGLTHFVEVKSVSCESNFRPEDQMHVFKQRRLIRTIESYTAARPIGDWTFDVACVYMDMANRKARVKIIDDIILS